MNARMTVAACSILLIATACAAARHPETAPVAGWKPWLSTYSDKEYPVIRVRYDDGSIMVGKRQVSVSALADDLRSLATVPGHPLVLLSAQRSDLPRAKALMQEINQTGVCEDLGCYYEFR